MSEYLAALSRPIDFGFQGVTIQSQQDGREAFRVEKQNGGFFSVQTDSNGDALLRLEATGGAVFLASVQAAGEFGLSLSDGQLTHFYSTQSGSTFGYVRTAVAGASTLVTTNRVFACTAGGFTITVNDFAEGQIQPGNWFIIYDEAGAAAASPITISPSGVAFNGNTLTNLTISENYGGYYFLAKDYDEWTVWRLSPAVPSGVINGITARIDNYTLTGSDYFVRMWTVLGSDLTATLPAAASHKGRVYVIKKYGSETNTVTIDPDGSETIDGESTKVMATENEAYMIQSDGSNWFVLSHTPNSSLLLE